MFLRSLLVGAVLAALTPLAPAQQTAPAAATPPEAHAARAHAFVEQKRPDLAIPEFEAVLAADPTNLDAQANLGVLLFFRGDAAGAVPHLRAAVSQNPDLAKIRALLGLGEQALGQTAPARTDLQAAFPVLTETPIRIQTGLALVELDESAGDHKGSADVLASLREIAPEDPRVLYAAYSVASEQASEALLTLSLVAPESPQIHQAIAHQLVPTRDFAAVVDNLRKAEAADPHLPGVHYELAEALRMLNDTKDRGDAEAEYKLALAQSPGDVRSMVALGDLATARGDFAAAEADYTEALGLSPNLTDAEVGLARVHSERGDYAGAAALLQKATAADPTDSLAHYRLSLADRRLGKTAAADEELAAYKHYRQLKAQLRNTYRQLRDEDSAVDAGGMHP